MDTLAKLFSSGTLIKVMRLFLFNGEAAFDLDDVVARTHARRGDVAHEVSLLEDIGFLKKRTVYREAAVKSAKGSRQRRGRKKKVRGWVLNHTFEYLPQLRALLVSKQLLDKRAMRERFRRVGKVRLILASGVFVQEPDAQLDLLIVADQVRPSALHEIVKSFEALIGSELRYALLGSEDFRYRLSVRDRLLRDVLERPYAEVVNTYKSLELPTQLSR